jgi:NAD(P)-dependent dehydrogenase (short-subunit alcohol dehydrogenase family)
MPLKHGHLYEDLEFGAIVGLTKAALELGRYGIRVNALLPRMIRTALTAGAPEEQMAASEAALRHAGGGRQHSAHRRLRCQLRERLQLPDRRRHAVRHPVRGLSRAPGRTSTR